MASWIGLEILIPKHPWKSKIGLHFSCKTLCDIFLGHPVHVVKTVTYFQANKNFEQKKIFPFKTLNLNPINGDDSTNWQVDMSKCMVAYIDWYHERIDGEGGREKIKVGDEIMISY